MADLQILTENAAGDGWVDAIPSAVSTGYTHQNTNITARSLGLDSTTVVFEGGNIVVKAGGVVDVNGVPYSLPSDVSFGYGGTGVLDLYIQVDPGATATEKGLSLVSGTPVWNPAKNYYESSIGRRILNKFISIMDAAREHVSIQPMIGALDDPTERDSVSTSFFVGFVDTNGDRVDNNLYEGRFLKKPTGEVLMFLPAMVSPNASTSPLAVGRRTLHFFFENGDPVPSTYELPRYPVVNFATEGSMSHHMDTMSFRRIVLTGGGGSLAPDVDFSYVDYDGVGSDTFVRRDLLYTTVASDRNNILPSTTVC